MKTKPDSASELARNKLENTLKSDGKPWKHSRIMIIGEGRAGKTALANSIMGKGYVETQSTVGIHEEVCDVDLSYASISGGQWTQYRAPVRQLEHALASMMHASASCVVNSSNSVHSTVRVVTSVVSDMHHLDSTELDELVSANQTKQDSINSLSSALQSGALQSSHNLSTESKDATAVELGIVNSCNSPNSVDMQSNSHSNSSTSSPVGPKSDPTHTHRDVVQDIDETLLKELGKTVTPTNIVVTVSDYGGQEVFYTLHHLFMTRNAVYIVVFNMEWLLEDGPI